MKIIPLPDNNKMTLRPRKKLRALPVLKKKKQIKSSSSSIEEITKNSFEAAQKSSTTVTEEDRSKPSSWVKTRLLGKGSFGSVYLATSKDEKIKRGEVAIKTAEFSKASSLMDEGRILIRLDSPFVVRCYGDEIAREDETDHHDCMQYNLIMEYCSGLTIADLIENNHNGLSESHVKYFTRDILSGLRYIHDSYIIHCDIKPENLFLVPTDPRFRPNGYLTKLGDFGLAIQKGSLECGNGFDLMRGTTSYLAPEVARRGFLDFGSDIWALGCTVLEMLTGKKAWSQYNDLDNEDLLTVISHCDSVPFPKWLSHEAKDFLSRCFERDLNKRWSSYSLSDHPFVLL